MKSLTKLLQNDDVAPRIPLLINTMKDPSTAALQQAIHALSQTTFVAEVTAPTLALLTPILGCDPSNGTVNSGAIVITHSFLDNVI